MLEGLRSYFILIKDFLMGIIDGLTTLSEAFQFIMQITLNFHWMPNFVFTIVGFMTVIIIVLRVVGR